MRRAPAALTLALAVPALAVLPVASTPAPDPEPVSSEVTTLPLAGVDGAALASAEAAQSRTASLAARAAAPAEDRGAAPAARPAVLTPERRTEPFSTVGVSWHRPSVPTELTVLVRTHGEDGWSGWTALEQDVDTDPAAADPAALPVLTAPLWAGPSDGVQVRVDVREGVLPTGLEVTLVDPGESDYDGVAADAGQPASTAAAAAAQPAIRSRAQWGADESKRSGSPTIMPTVRAGTLHHTAGANGYSASEVPGIIRGDYAYHVSKGYSDIGYNFLVDRFGTVWEGRAGGITKAVQGAHSGGFNTETFGVSVLGNYETAASNASIVDAVSRVFGWKLSLFGRDPQGKVTLTSAGGGTSKYAAGEKVTVPVVFAHRDVGATACPGANLFAQMGAIRSKAKAYAGTTAPAAPAAPTTLPASATAISGDWDGDGTDDLGWFSDGRWALRNGSGAVVRFSFGMRGDLPLIGDWNADGTDSIGVFRAGRWYLRNANSAGGHDALVAFGVRGDRPVVGAWRGGRTEGIAVKRGSRWFLRNTATTGPAEATAAFGGGRDQALAGDWDRNGTDTIGVARGSAFYLASSATAPTAVAPLLFGNAKDQKVVGDWTGNGRTRVGVARGESFYLRVHSQEPVRVLTVGR
jgi:hypothetical protein